MNKQPSNPMHVCAILGTSRPGSYTGHAFALVLNELEANGVAALDVIRPADLVLGFPDSGEDDADAEAMREMVGRADGLIFATPEYHGGMAAMAKLIIENLGFPSVLKGKPVALVGCAAGDLGAVKALEQLRSILSHVGALPLPGAVSVAGVRDVFNEDGTCNDDKTEARIRTTATRLTDYLTTGNA
jgi:FMN reductase